MKKIRGFTLVELLGVIVVLAILVLITIPIISNVINDVRIKSLQNSAYGLIEASNIYYVQIEVNSNIRFDKNDSKDTLKELSYKGVVKEGTVIISKKGEVTVCITDGKNSAYKNYNESKVTTKKGKCEIFEGSSIVYLDGEATIDYYDNTKLTEVVNELIEKNNELESKIDNLKSHVGSIVYSSTLDTEEKVKAIYGGTSWKKIEGKFLLGASSEYEINETGGEATHILTSAEMPSHTHDRGTMNITGTFATSYYNDGTWQDILSVIDGPFYSIGAMYQISPFAASKSGNSTFSHKWGFDASRSWTGETSLEGGSQPHNNMPPYKVVYIWERTA